MSQIKKFLGFTAEDCNVISTLLSLGSQSASGEPDAVVSRPGQYDLPGEAEAPSDGPLAKSRPTSLFSFKHSARTIAIAIGQVNSMACRVAGAAPGRGQLFEGATGLDHNDSDQQLEQLAGTELPMAISDAAARKEFDHNRQIPTPLSSYIYPVTVATIGATATAPLLGNIITNLLSGLWPAIGTVAAPVSLSAVGWWLGDVAARRMDALIDRSDLEEVTGPTPWHSKLQYCARIMLKVTVNGSSNLLGATTGRKSRERWMAGAGACVGMGGGLAVTQLIAGDTMLSGLAPLGITVGSAVLGQVALVLITDKIVVPTLLGAGGHEGTVQAWKHALHGKGMVIGGLIGVVITGHLGFWTLPIAAAGGGVGAAYRKFFKPASAEDLFKKNVLNAIGISPNDRMETIQVERLRDRYFCLRYLAENYRPEQADNPDHPGNFLPTSQVVSLLQQMRAALIQDSARQLHATSRPDSLAPGMSMLEAEVVAANGLANAYGEFINNSNNIRAIQTLAERAYAPVRKQIELQRKIETDPLHATPIRRLATWFIGACLAVKESFSDFANQPRNNLDGSKGDGHDKHHG